jgi:hypothetical protein
MRIEYWDGSNWTEVQNGTDGTLGLTQTGVITFTTPRQEVTRWKKRTLNGAGPYYWVRIVADYVNNPPTIVGILRNRTGKFYLSNVHCVIGKVNNQVPSMHAQQRWADGRSELSATTMPSTGTWRQGDLVWKSNPSIISGTNPRYHLLGWRRITTGSGHSLNTDWLEMRVPAAQVNYPSYARTATVQVDEQFEFLINPASAELYLISLGASGATIVAGPGSDGQRMVIRIAQTNGGGHTVSWDSTAFRFGSDIPSITLSTGNGKSDYITCVYDSADSKWDIVHVVKGF